MIAIKLTGLGIYYTLMLAAYTIYYSVFAIVKALQFALVEFFSNPLNSALSLLTAVIGSYYTFFYFLVTAEYGWTFTERIIAMPFVLIGQYVIIKYVGCPIGWFMIQNPRIMFALMVGLIMFGLYGLAVWFIEFHLGL